MRPLFKHRYIHSVFSRAWDRGNAAKKMFSPFQQAQLRDLSRTYIVFKIRNIILSGSGSTITQFQP